MFHTPYEAAPFSQFTAFDYLPAIQTAINDSLAEIQKISKNYKPATFENTILPLAYNDLRLERLTSMFFNLNSAATTPELQAQAQLISPLLSEYTNDVRLNAVLFKRIKAIYRKREKLSLTAEQCTLVEKMYHNFMRNGVHLRQRKIRLREIDRDLAALKLKFSENLLAENQLFFIHITNPIEVTGLPDYALQMATAEAAKRKLESWVFTLDFPLYTAVMKYADNRELRRKLFIAYHKRGANDNEYNNEEIVWQISLLRRERARLLGYENYATFVLEDRMAESPQQVNDFLQSLLEQALPLAKQELKTLRIFSKIDDFQQWDFPYYAEKLKQEEYQIDDQQLKPYLALDKAVQGMFAVANKKLYGLHFALTDEVEKYHQEVQTYKVTDAEGNYVALLYTDFFPRAGKRNGAWMTTFKDQYIDLQGNDSRPHISIVCNFTRPTDTEPSLLTFNELTTLFHEFGHALHGMLSRVTYPSLSGTNVARDFVELPSQLMENWCYEEETLRLFATHYQTGEPLPMEWVHRIKKAQKFMEGLLTVRQLVFGILDMAWHSVKYADEIRSTKGFEHSLSLPQMFPPIEEICISTGFSHIFSGGYAAGYYSYKWAEVLEKEAFGIFEAAGIFNPEVATRFRKEILEKGSSEKEMTLFKRFKQ
ncbi:MULTISPECIES: M3 family metallopeptidase [Capnocytophaga]|uniref:M3 family metallopeptidase n=1 Tax=Capnocytophaga TaxID=1016 RepID=UPI00020C6FF4|nr:MULTISPECIES: M3 family metallopeptidase [unclassified Capnocytophaga]KHE70364.1 putative oligopeptidase A [Capnocytophaga sp. oral taxon 329 str. F0087]QGS18426.1 M3 family peptidase [Capnocytophaga sp. FDAARGOS_737]